MINSTFYIFGNLGSGYTQYPFDYAKNILSSLISETDAKTMLAVRRENNLMYYCYLRRLEGVQYIGFCALLNGLMFSNVKELFSVFENAVTFMVTSGGIIGFSSEGDIVATTSTLIGKEKDIDSAFSYIQNGLSKLEHDLKKLPPVSYSISKSETKSFSATDDDKSIADASCKYGCTFVIKDKGYNTASLLGYKGVVVRLNKEKDNLARNYAELNEKYQKVSKQKKQVDKIVVLLLILLVFGVGIYFLNDSLNTTRSQLTDANNRIAQKNRQIEVQQGQISELTNKYNNTVQERDALDEEFSDYKNLVSRCQPFLFKGSSFNFNTNDYTFDYYGLKEGYQSVTMRVISPDGSIRNYDYNVYVSNGENSASLSVNGYFYNNSYYVFELLYDGKVIGGGRH